MGAMPQPKKAAPAKKGASGGRATQIERTIGVMAANRASDIAALRELAEAEAYAREKKAPGIPSGGLLAGGDQTAARRLSVFVGALCHAESGGKSTKDSFSPTTLESPGRRC
jgi:hypothetical protein